MDTVSIVQPSWRKDIVLIIVLALAALILPFSFDETMWLPQGYRLFAPALIAVAIGAILARTPFPLWFSMIFGSILGLEYSINWVADVMPRAEIIWRDLQVLFPWLKALLLGQWPEPITPFSGSLQHVARALEDMWERLVDWWAVLQLGQSSLDTTALKLGAVFLVWFCALWAALYLIKARKPIIALLPIGISTIINAAYTGLGSVFVYIFFALFLVAMFWNRIITLESRWNARGLDVALSVRERSVNSSVTIIVLLLGISLLMPVATWHRAVDYFWNHYGDTFESFYDNLDRAFAGRNPLPTVVATGPEGLGSHSVYSAPVFQNDRMLLVRTSDPIPHVDEEELAYEESLQDYVIGQLPKRYWRERTYDIYTGRGWDTSEVVTELWGADDTWVEIDYPTEIVTQTYTLLAYSSEYGLGVNAMASVDEPYTVLLRDEGDMAAYSIEATRYTVTSLVATPAREDLIAAEEDYPDWITAQYLQLPEELPERVIERAQEIVDHAGATTRYEKARAIEAYLRQYQYNLDVEPVPYGEDLVDYFLFETQEGFCDYSASAMVVMLRAVGVAARYVSGYNQGQFDVLRGAWLVMDYNAHAWPEVYFPGIGWVEFEPTPSQNVFDRSSEEAEETEDIEVLPLPLSTPIEPDQDVTLPQLWWLIIPILGTGLFLLMRPKGDERVRFVSPEVEVTSIYRKMVRLSRWIGFGPVSSETPREFVASLGPALERRARFAKGSANDVNTIGQAYEMAAYEKDPPTNLTARIAREAYTRLRMVLVRMLFQRKKQEAVRKS